jgi:hypothetical protein
MLRPATYAALLAVPLAGAHAVEPDACANRLLRPETSYQARAFFRPSRQWTTAKAFEALDESDPALVSIALTTMEPCEDRVSDWADHVARWLRRLPDDRFDDLDWQIAIDTAGIYLERVNSRPAGFHRKPGAWMCWIGLQDVSKDEEIAVEHQLAAGRQRTQGLLAYGRRLRKDRADLFLSLDHPADDPVRHTNVNVVWPRQVPTPEGAR